jgi:hypothetical protein
MAAIQHSTRFPQPVPRPRVPAGDPPHSLARAYLLRLAQLHDEAARTAFLASLLSRSSYAAAAVAAAAVVTVIAAAPYAPAAQLATWFVLVFIGIASMAWAYSRAIRAPFELAVLQDFARDLAATLVYSGFAWGAGAMLVLPQNAGLPVVLAFCAGAPALLAACLRVRDMTLCFLVPAISLSAFAAILRPLQGGLGDLAALLIAGAAIAAAVQVAERLTARPDVPEPAGPIPG